MIDDLLLFDIGLLEDTTTFVFGVLAGLPSIGLGLGNNFISGALSNNKSLRDSGVIALTVTQLRLELGDHSVFLGNQSRINACRLCPFVRRSGRALRDNLSARSRGCLFNLNAQTSDFVVQIVDLGSNALEKYIHFVNVVTATLDFEALILDVGRGDGHRKLPLSGYSNSCAR